jgi:hypothetical protein
MAVVVFGVGGRAGAQGPPISSEIRIDGFRSAASAIELGASVTVPGGNYARTAFTAATGVVFRDGVSASASRVELISRFLLDPFRESPYGLSVGGGAGITNANAGASWRPYLAAVIDLEFARRGPLTPALQLGLGGGARLGLILRTGNDRWR